MSNRAASARTLAAISSVTSGTTSIRRNATPSARSSRDQKPGVLILDLARQELVPDEQDGGGGVGGCRAWPWNVRCKQL